MISGVISSIAGIFWVLRYSSAQSDSVQGLELSVVAAVVLGGVSIFGGSGGIVGVVRWGAASSAPSTTHSNSAAFPTPC